MNDYTFGNYLCACRKKHGLSQSELAKELGVSGKAISKWENGVSKPRTDILKKLAVLWNVSLDELLQHEVKKVPKITRIVVTGGPCAGKSTGLSWIQNEFTDKGYRVLFVPETATELISSGISPVSCTSNLEYQKHQMDLQRAKEKIYEEAALSMACDKVLIVCDRGCLDNKAYMSNSDFALVLDHISDNETELRDGYDAVFHLATAAKGAEAFYTCSNNAARSESLEEAVAIDEKIISAWTGHPHFRIIENTGSFESKMQRLLKEIASFLGEPEPHEVERKFLIQKPDPAVLERMKNVQKVEIRQVYLQDAKEETRIRQRGLNGNYIYTLTKKTPISDLERIETERRLSREEFLDLLMKADPNKMPIRKDRYCLSEDGQYFEIDLYPFWKDKAVLEIELMDPDQEIQIPNWLHVIKEVTNDPAYKNSALASNRGVVNE